MSWHLNMLKNIFHDCSHTADVEILLRGYGSLYWLDVHVHHTVVNKTLHTWWDQSMYHIVPPKDSI